MGFRLSLVIAGYITILMISASLSSASWVRNDGLISITSVTYNSGVLTEWVYIPLMFPGLEVTTLPMIWLFTYYVG